MPMVMTGRLRTQDRIGGRPVIWWGVTARRDGGMQLTAFGAQDRGHFEGQNQRKRHLDLPGRRS
jgi:hypothetical protein